MPGHALPAQLLLNPLLQMEPDVSLAHGRALRQFKGRNLSIHRACSVKRLAYDSHLGAVSMADDDLMPLFYKSDKGRSRIVNALLLLLRRIAQGIAAQGYYDS